MEPSRRSTAATRFDRWPAFTLVEVVIALGVAGISLVVVLGLMPSLAAAQREGADRFVAHHLAPAIEAALAGDSAAHFDVWVAELAEVGGSATERGTFVADRAGENLRHAAPGESGTLAAGYFLVECWRVAGGAGLARVDLQVRVSWPLAAINAGGPSRPVTRQWEFLCCVTR